ncbi:8694_t:CDS:2, partial [Racocetra persica]
VNDNISNRTSEELNIIVNNDEVFSEKELVKEKENNRHATKTASQDKQELLTLLQQEKIEHIFQLNKSVFFKNNEYIENKEGYIVSGRDFATNILSNAKLKILLTANFKTHVQRRLNQLKSNDHNTIHLDIIK